MSEPRIALLSEDDISTEIGETRSSLLTILRPVAFALAWLWLYYALTSGLPPFSSAVPFLIVSGGALFLQPSRVRSFQLAPGSIPWPVIR